MSFYHYKRIFIYLSIVVTQNTVVSLQNLKASHNPLKRIGEDLSGQSPSKRPKFEESYVSLSKEDEELIFHSIQIAKDKIFNEQDSLLKEIDADPYLFGLSYALGIQRDKNLKEAVKKFEEAAKRDHKKAKYCLGLFHAMGWGVEDLDHSTNVSKSFNYFKSLAEEKWGDASSMIELYYSIPNHNSEDKQPLSSAAYRSKYKLYKDIITEAKKPSSELHDKYSLGLLYAFDWDLSKKNIEKSIRYLREAAAQSYSGSKFILECIYYFESKRNSEDLKANPDIFCQIEEKGSLEEIRNDFSTMILYKDKFSKLHRSFDRFKEIEEKLDQSESLNNQSPSTRSPTVSNSQPLRPSEGLNNQPSSNRFPAVSNSQPLGPHKGLNNQPSSNRFPAVSNSQPLRPSESLNNQLPNVSNNQLSRLNDSPSSTHLQHDPKDSISPITHQKKK